MEYTSLIFPGDKIDIFASGLSDNSTSYKSSFSDKLTDSMWEITMPVDSGRVVLFQLGTQFDFIIYTQNKTILKSSAIVRQRYRKENMYFLAIELINNLEKIQRRQFFRLPCTIDMDFYEVRYDDKAESEPEFCKKMYKNHAINSKNMNTVKSVILDISGGGIRFSLSTPLEEGTYFMAQFSLALEECTQQFNIVCKVINCTQSLDYADRYFARSKFIFDRMTEREKIVRFVFEEERRIRLLFIIPAVIIAIILIICIAVAVSSKSGEKGKKKDSRSVSVTENTQDIAAESETLELVKKDALKETNVVDKDNKQNNGTQSDTNDNSAPAAGNSDNANKTSDKSSDKSSEDKTAADKKTSTSSNNTQQPAGNDSKPAASNQTVAPEPAQSEPAQPEAPKNEYVAPGWIFYGSKAGNGMSGEQKAYVDSVIQQWTNGGLSDDAIGDMFIEKIAQEWQLPMITAGVTSNLLCLFPSRAEVPDYSLNLADMNGAYNFVGLYTNGEYDENGYLKCYYWEAGVL